MNLNDYATLFARELIGSVFQGDPVPVVVADSGVRREDFPPTVAGELGMGALWEAILATDAAGRTCTPTSVYGRLQGRSGASDDAQVAACQELMDVGGPGRAVEAARSLAECGRQRRAMAELDELSANGARLGPGMFDQWLVGACDRLSKHALGAGDDAAVGIGTLTRAVVARMLANEEPPRVMMGLSRLDNIVGGFRAGRSYIVSAETKGGKTSFATQVCWQAALAGCPVLALSMEMGKDELAERILSQQTGVRKCDIESGFRRLSGPAAVAVKEHAVKAATFEDLFRVDDRGGLSLADMRARILRWQMDPKVKAARTSKIQGVVMVDYLQLAVAGRSRKETREQEIAEVSEGLKVIAKHSGVAVLALAQLNRQGQTRGSSQIDMDADCVMRLHYPGDVPPGEDTMRPHRVDITIDRNRHGFQRVVVPLIFDGELTRFSVFEEVTI